MKTAEIHTMDGAYMIEFGRVPDGFRVQDLSGDTMSHTYTPPYSPHLYYYTTYGVWRRTTGNGEWEFSSDKGGRNYRPAIIRECGIPQEIKGKHYDAMIEDDILEGEPTTAAEVKKTVDWYEKAKKEVKGKMTNKSLFHVILFNRKTEEIDFKEYIPAGNEQAAVMQAAQTFGKYDSKVHLTIVKDIQYSEYATIE